LSIIQRLIDHLQVDTVLLMMEWAVRRDGKAEPGTLSNSVSIARSSISDTDPELPFVSVSALNANHAYAHS